MARMWPACLHAYKACKMAERAVAWVLAAWFMMFLHDPLLQLWV
jgi:hypothetical protein